MELKKRLRNKKGFTLIEIIAVLVILAIMAAVAVPKYLSLQQQAANDAAAGACAAAASTVSMVYANYLMNGTTVTNSTLATTLNTVGGSLGDYTATYAAGTTGTLSIVITITGFPTGTTTPNANTTKTVVLIP